MEQTNIFDYLDETDELLLNIEKLQYGESMIVDNIIIMRYKYFEVLHEDFHEHFRTAKATAHFVTNQQL